MANIKEVAAQAGVSTTTVSHVINETRFVAEETRERLAVVERHSSPGSAVVTGALALAAALLTAASFTGLRPAGEPANR